MNKLIDAFPNWLEGKGIFDELNKLDVPWTTNSLDLDLEYFGNHSGEKISAPLVEKLSDNGVLSDVSRARLASVIFNLNHENWDRLYLALQKEYDPLQNYNGTETRTITTDNTGSSTLGRTGTESTNINLVDTNIKSGNEVIASSGSDSLKKTGSDTETIDSGVTETKSGTNNVTRSNSSSSTNSDSNDNSVYGFNSSSASPSDKSVSSSNNSETSSGTDNTTINETNGTEINNTTTNTHDTTDTQTYGKSDTHTYNSVKDEHSNNGSSVLTLDTTNTGSTSGHSESTDSFHREGNYGVRSSQEMIEQEFELRIKYRFFDVVFGDLDKTLALSIY